MHEEIVKNDELIFIERCITTIKENVSIEENIHKIENALERLFGINAHISIIDNNSGEFFGVNIFPNPSVIDEVVHKIVVEKCNTDETYGIWSNTKEWYIEIDSLLLSPMDVNASPPEVTAVILHEIAYTIYSNIIPYRLYKVLCYKLMKLKLQLRQLISTDKIRKIFNIAVLESCSNKNFNFINDTIRTDIDKFVVDHGYCDHFNNFLNKLIETHGNSLINRIDFEVEREIDAIINWAITNVKELEFRKKNLRTALKTEMIKTPSLYIKKSIQEIFVSFFGDATDKYRELLSEQYMDVSKDVYQELYADQCLDRFVKKVLTEASGNIFDKKGKLKKVTQSDIDILTVEAEKIESIDDKIYLLDKLYREYELVVLGLEYIDSSVNERHEKVVQSRSMLLNMKKQLEKLREQIMATKIIEKDYGVFIRYPKGYQG